MVTPAPRTNADKRKSVEVGGVSHKFVGNVREENEPCTVQGSPTPRNEPEEREPAAPLCRSASERISSERFGRNDFFDYFLPGFFPASSARSHGHDGSFQL